MDRDMARALANGAAAARAVLSELEASLTPEAMDRVIYGNAKVGYDTGGHNWAFSAVTTTLTIEKCEPGDANRADATIALLAYTPSEYGVSIGVRCGGGDGSVRYYDSQHLPPAGGRPFQGISPRVGDILQIELFHNAEQELDYGTATTIRQTVTGDLLLQRQVLTSPAPSVVVRHASLAAYVNAGANTSADVRLWQYRDIRVRSRDGTNGTVLGPWSTTQFIATKDGTSSGKVVADTFPHHGGGTVDLWLRAAT